MYCTAGTGASRGNKKGSKKDKGTFKVKRVKRKDAPEGADASSDSDIERENIDAFWEGKHVPCIRPGLVIEKCTLTKKEAARRVSPSAIEREGRQG